MNNGQIPVNQERTSEILELAWRKFKVSAGTPEAAAVQLNMRAADAGQMDAAEVGRVHDALLWSVGIAEPTPRSIPDLPDWLLLTWAASHAAGPDAKPELAAALRAEIARRRLASSPAGHDDAG